MNAELDMGPVEKSIDVALRRGQSLGPVFHDILGPLKVDQKDHAQDREGPEGAWPPRAAATIAKARQLGRLRRPLGKLTTLITYRSSSSGAVAESRVAWSGGAISTGGRVGKGAVLPARPWLWLSEQLQRFAAEMIVDFVFGDWGR